MHPDARAFLKTFAKVLGLLAALVALFITISAVGFRYLFRSHEEPSISDAEAIRRFAPVWGGPMPLKVETVRILHHRKEIIWDGTTHEEWTVFMPGDLKLESRSSPFLRIDQATAWPLPEAATSAGFSALFATVYLAEAATPSSGSERPTNTRAVVWPVSGGYIVHLEFTVID